MKHISVFFSEVINAINKYAENAGNPYKAFGIFAIITYPLYYVIWISTESQGYENLTLRLIAVLLAIPLVFSRSWPFQIRKYLPLYWYITLLYALPFLFTFLLLKNHFSYAWVLNTTTTLTLLVLLLDLTSLLIVLPLGIILGWLSFIAVDNTMVYPKSAVIISYLSIVVFGALFAHRKNISKRSIVQKQIQTFKQLSATVAHELFTPLKGIQFGAELLREDLPDLTRGYEISVENKLIVENIDARGLQNLSKAVNNIIKEVDASFLFIEMLLSNIQAEKFIGDTLQTCHIADAVNEALERYPFNTRQKQEIQVNLSHNFTFSGSQKLLVHVLFNLFKNALYYIAKARKGNIAIWTEEAANKNILHFKDTGWGIPADILPYIFEQFFSNTLHGTGVGLAYCEMVMQSFGGNIKCKSILGEYTEFILIFPKVS